MITISNESITISKQPIERAGHIKFLDVIVDGNLSWAYHIKEITSKRAKSAYQFARIKNFVEDRCRKTFYHSHIHSKFEFGKLLFFFFFFFLGGGGAAHQLRPLKSLQQRAVKLIVKNSSNDAFKTACILPFSP